MKDNRIIKMTKERDTGQGAVSLCLLLFEMRQERNNEFLRTSSCHNAELFELIFFKYRRWYKKLHIILNHYDLSQLI